MICVEMNQKLILDGYEDFPMVYSREALSCCAGEDSKIIEKLTKVRRLSRKPE